MASELVEARAKAFLDAVAGSPMDHPKHAVYAVGQLLASYDELRVQKQEFREEATRWAEEAGRLKALLHDAQRDAEKWRACNWETVTDDGVKAVFHVNVAVNYWKDGEWLGFDGDIETDSVIAEYQRAKSTMAAEREGQ